ncbi:MAG: CehA/McbA family metallohydrolase [Polyangiaceae bacterium]
MRRYCLIALGFSLAPIGFGLGCGDDSHATGGAGGAGGGANCQSLAFETGDPNGHADPLGAKAAGQARAGRIKATDVPQPAHGRQRIEDGDFLLINDKIAIVIEDKDVSDGNGRFGGEVLSVDRVGDDGKPLGLSKFLETLQLTSAYQVNPTSVTVMNDGSDGAAAVVRAIGPLEAIPFLRDTFGPIFPSQYAGLVAAYDYVLEPGAEALKVRFGFINTTDYEVDTGVHFDGSWNLYGFFQGSQNDHFVPGLGYGQISGSVEYAGFENDVVPFAYLGPNGTGLDYGGFEDGGFVLFGGPGLAVGACSMDMVEDHEIVVGEPFKGVDGLGAAVRRVTGQPAWRTITGRVVDSQGQGLENAYVHVLADNGDYLNRVKTGPCQGANGCGDFTVEAPEGTVQLIADKQGYGTTLPIDVADGDAGDLAFAPVGYIHVSVTDQATGDPMPARIQVIPAIPPESLPEAFGHQEEANGRLWQEFSVTGDATLAAPLGENRVVVSHGYEWELVDTTVDVAEGATVDVAAALVHSVDTTGRVSADFHIHSMYSVDSDDPTVYKVRGALADGLEVPVSSEHEWIFDFQGIIEDFGATNWAHGLPSEELSTFTWGHFGVVPILPRPDKVNNGAIDWLDKSAEQIFDEVHALPEAPALIVNHPSDDAAFKAYFTKVALDRETGTSPDPLWSDHFDAVEVFNDSDFDENRERSVADWFALLRTGKTFWVVGSSDSHTLRTNPVGYPRNLLAVGYDDPNLVTPEDVRDAILHGHSTVSGGLVMTVDGPGGTHPGDSTAWSATADFVVTVECPSWMPADTLEVIVNGETVSTEPLLPVGNGPGKRFVNSVSVNLPSGVRGWVIFHAKGAGDLSPVHPGRRPFAVSNPILFQP